MPEDDHHGEGLSIADITMEKDRDNLLMEHSDWKLSWENLQALVDGETK
jgi:hypothetical protein